MTEKIEIKIQTEKRITAINNLAIAIKHVAKSLSAVPQVNISSCNFQGGDPAINIETFGEEIDETITMKGGE